MKRYVFLVMVIAPALTIFHKRLVEPRVADNVAPALPVTQPRGTPHTPVLKNDIAPSRSSSAGSSARLGASPTQSRAGVPLEKTPLLLAAGNFESFVARCFQGEPCRLVDDPKQMYKDFKLAENKRACEDLIAFLRKQLLEPELRETYKQTTKEMIDDFYPPEKREFQDAAFYAYTGDLQKSLDLYLDTTKRAQADSTKEPAPPLNVANVLYDMRRFKEALPYYEAALHDYMYGEQTLSPSTNETLAFIESRISQIKAKF